MAVYNSINESPTHIKSNRTLFEIIEDNPYSKVFDVSDVDYLVHHLKISELQKEISNAFKRFDNELEWKRQFYYVDFILSCRLAVTILKSYELPQTITPGHRIMIDVDELKSSVDIVDVAERYTQLVKAGQVFRACCPFHSETKPSFTVYPRSHTWHCFGACNTGGDVISLVMKAENLDFKGAITLLRGHTNGI